MSLHMHEKELKSFAKSILMKDKNWVSVFEDGDSGKTYFILWDIFMINETLGVKVKNDSEYSHFSETYKIDLEQEENEGKELLDTKQLLDCAVIYELPRNSKKWEEELQKLLSRIIPSIPLAIILKEKDIAKVLASFEDETGAKKYDYRADFEENGLDIFYAICKSFDFHTAGGYNRSSRKISQVVLDVDDLYNYNNYHSNYFAKKWQSSSEKINYRTLGIFSKKPNKQKIIMKASVFEDEDEEIGEFLNCNYLLENQAKAADKFRKVAEIVETLLQDEMLYSRYLTKDQVRSYKNY